MIILWLIFFALLIFHVATRYSRRGRLYSKIPGPKILPIFGNVFTFAHCDQQELWRFGRELVKKYYPVSRFWGFEQPVVNICHPDDLEILLSSQKAIEKGFAYWYIEPWMASGLLTSTDDKWRHRRKILTPAFHFGILKKYMEITIEQGEKMIESLKKEGDEAVISLAPLFSNYTLNIICESTMGVALDKLDIAELTQYKQAVHNMGSVIMYRLLRPHLINCIFPYVPKWGSMQKKALKILHGFTAKVIKERREYHKSDGDKFLNEYNESDGSIYEDSKIGMKKRMAMLDLLLAAEKKKAMDNAGIQEEVDTFIFEAYEIKLKVSGFIFRVKKTPCKVSKRLVFQRRDTLLGHDTTSAAMTFITLLLAENKDAQDRARAEVTAIIDAANGKVGIAEVQEFHYLERCIKESFRMFPPVPTLLRYIREDIQLKHVLLPAYTHIMIHFWDTHRDPKFWPEPEKFDPDRFLPENSKTRHPFSYVPFSAGPRNCIGQKFAMMEIKSLLGRILYDFYLEPIERTADIPLVADLVMRTRDPVHVKFVKINKQ